MASKQQRLELQIDVLDKTNQRAQVLPTVTAPELIAAVLSEFRELEYLGDAPDAYQLQRANDRSVLDSFEPLGKQAEANGRLLLVEKARPLPANTQPPSRPVYLREQSSGKVYKLDYLPALIGRADKSIPQNELLAVNLESYRTGGRVSRRHVQISEENGQFYVACLADNPAFLRRDVLTNEVTAERQPLQPGDLIVLGRSYIELKFIVRGE